MTFNIFGPPTRDNIRVGYISTSRGYVEGVSICDANTYAKENPGTRFIFKNREVVKYLSINEVNKLTSEDLKPKDPCKGIAVDDPCKPPQITFSGGGGVGAKANPVIGLDGSVLAVDIVNGGNGYKFDPIVEIIDNCGIGAGSVLTPVLGTVIDVVEVFEGEDDFEEYEICDTSPETFGKRYDANGKEVGQWDPFLYTQVEEDPIRREIQIYQDFLKEIKKPWWTTRKNPPLRNTSQNKVTRTKFDVDFPAWNNFMNKYAISPVPKSNVKGSDFAGIPFTFEWEEDFPYDGDYIFNGLCDNKAELYVDNVKLADLKSFQDSPQTIKKSISAGIHNIRIDLLNVPITETIVQQIQSNIKLKFVQKGTNFYIEASGEGTCESQIVMEVDDDKNIAGTSARKIVIPSESGDLEFRRKDDLPSKETIKRRGVFVGGKTYGPVQIIGASDKVQPPVIAKPNILGLLDQRDDDLNIKVIIVEVNQKDAPSPQPSTAATNIKTKKIFNTESYINKADRPLWRMFPSVGRDGDFIHQYGVTPFNPNTSAANTDDFAGTHVIRWENIDFPVDGNYTIETMVDDNVTIYIGNRSGGGATNIGNGLVDVRDGGDEVIVRKRGYNSSGKSTGKSTETRFFKKGKYRIRAELEQIPGKPLAQGNPMALAINIEAAFVQGTFISPKSWNENPMGVSLTIDAPVPPIPKEPIPQQKGRCPNNPIWTTRFPNSRETWNPVRFDRPNSWSKFMNRYAISPILPLADKGSDGGGVPYRNSWTVDLPYAGFYGLRGTVDNFGKILIDGNEILSLGKGGVTQTKKLSSFGESNPPVEKVYLTKGIHTIEVEVENQVTDTFKQIDKRIFSTRDWEFTPSTSSSDIKPKFVNKGNDIFLEVGGQGSGKINFVLEVDDNKGTEGISVTKLSIVSDEGIVVFNRDKSYPSKETVKASGTFSAGKTYGPLQISKTAFNSLPPKAERNLVRFYDDGGSDTNAKLLISDIKNSSSGSSGLTEGTSKKGVSYSGPELASYVKGFISPLIKNTSGNTEEIQDKTWTMKWTDVDFPEDGQYRIRAEGDDIVQVRIDGQKVGEARVFQGVKEFYVNLNAGKRTVELELYNIRIPNTGFAQNPAVAFAEITKKVTVSTGIGRAWTENPIGISAVLIPPPCPKRVSGKGVITDVIVLDPGNGYPIPLPEVSPEVSTTYPVSLRIKDVEIEDGGVGYNCGVDQLVISPNSGAELSYECDQFGRIIKVNVVNPGIGFTSYPDIFLDSETGVNAVFRPQFEVVRDPIDAIIEGQIGEDQLIQVTDLVGLKQTGYVNGRAYYGAVFYKNGIRFAGFYETAGDPIQVYDTLQESIDAEVTTQPSAILRQGTDISSNNPRLNIPGTPDNLI